jgi:uncharacterized protein YjiS (DUF1127 family)
MSNPNTSCTAIASASDVRVSYLVLDPATIGREERSLAVADRANLFVAFALWIAKAHTARSRRATLVSLLELDHDRLEDLGISREDLIKAMAANAQTGPVLHAARSRNSSI